MAYSWFRSDFNISYRYVNRPGPDGDKKQIVTIFPPNPVDNQEVLSRTELIIVIVVSILGFLILACLLIACLYNYSKRWRIGKIEVFPKNTTKLEESSS